MASTEVRMSDKRYRDEFKIEAVSQVTERGHKVAEVAKRGQGSNGDVSPVEFEKRYAQSGF